MAAEKKLFLASLKRYPEKIVVVVQRVDPSLLHAVTLEFFGVARVKRHRFDIHQVKVIAVDGDQFAAPGVAPFYVQGPVLEQPGDIQDLRKVSADVVDIKDLAVPQKTAGDDKRRAVLLDINGIDGEIKIRRAGRQKRRRLASFRFIDEGMAQTRARPQEKIFGSAHGNALDERLRQQIHERPGFGNKQDVVKNSGPARVHR